MGTAKIRQICRLGDAGSERIALTSGKLGLVAHQALSRPCPAQHAGWHATGRCRPRTSVHPHGISRDGRPICDRKRGSSGKPIWLGWAIPDAVVSDRPADLAFSIHKNVAPAYFTGRIIQGASDTIGPSLTCRSAKRFFSARRRRFDEPVENGQPVGDGFPRPGGQRIPLPRLQTSFGSPRPAGSIGLTTRSVPSFAVSDGSVEDGKETQDFDFLLPACACGRFQWHSCHTERCPSRDRVQVTSFGLYVPRIDPVGVFQ